MNPSNVVSPAPALAAGATPTHTVLVVDDSAVDRHLAGAIVHKLEGWQAIFAGHGREALEVIERQPPDIVLTDLLMPEMDGLELVQAVRAKYPLIPVILMTAHGSEDVAIQALQKGAASYVPKKSLARDLEETLDQVLAASQTNRSQKRIIDSLMHYESHFVIDNDTTLIAPLVGHIEQNLERMQACAPSGLILVGVALHEALTNAILHGNLELSSELRETDEKQYYRLGAERRSQSPYAQRRVSVKVSVSRQDAVFVVRDDGPGFDPATLPDPTDPANLGRVSGRGLLLIQTFMDRVEHNARGNEITMVKHVHRGASGAA
jgi:CheY-like chemotaxis protein/anti-sigma regulatory factor (Ser/Thr protein kinase)